MDVVVLNNHQSNFNYILSSSARLLSLSTQQMDSRLMAFLTILTVALSIMLSFKQSRHLLTVTTTYPLRNVKRKCLKCLTSLKTNSSFTYDVVKRNLIYTTSLTVSVSHYCSYSKYLKLKRLPNIASTIHYLMNKNRHYLSRVRKLRRYLPIGSFMRKRLVRTTNGMVGSRRQVTKSLGKHAKTTADFKLKLETIVDEDMTRSCCMPNECNHDLATETCDMVDIDDNYDETSPLSIIYSKSFYHISFYLNYLISGYYAMSYYYYVTKYQLRKDRRPYNSRIRLYKKLPLRSLSRAWGKLNAIELPVWFRSPIYKFYSWLFSCNLNEMDIEDLTHYKNLSEFFRRSLKPTARSIDSDCCLISPCDGKILNFGRVDNGLLEQVKGVNYSLKGFLGLQNWPKNQTNGNGQHALKDIKSESMADMQSLYEKIEDDNALYEKSVLYNKNNRLYHCVIYLAPGDYHRFHSPTDWTIFYRRHFPGELFSVNPSVARWLQGLFNLNERVVYYGQWKHGFFSMSPVGATNVGSISVFMDEKLTTNNKKLELDNYNDLDKSFSYRNETGLHGVNMKRGDLFGEFNLGSTIVLIFEAPDNFEFSSSPCDKVFFGQQLGSATSKFHEQKS